MNLRLTAVGRTPDLVEPAGQPALRQAEPIHEVDVVFRAGGALERRRTPVYRRADLGVGEPVEGPAIVVQTDATTVVPPGATCATDAAGNLIVSLE